MHGLRYLLGLMTLLGAVLGALWLQRTLRNLDDRPGVPLQVEFREARGLRPGAVVRHRGVDVGAVRSVALSPDGDKAVVQVLLDPAAAANACVGSAFWIVTPRFGGLTDGLSGLDTLVRDAYVAFATPSPRGTPLPPGSLVAGRERPPVDVDDESLEPPAHGDLLMTLLAPENHGLRPGSRVVHRGVDVGDVRRIALATDGSHVEVALRIAREHRATVTDKALFWIARPQLSGALLSGFTVQDAASLLSPFVGYHAEPGQGSLAPDGFRVAAAPSRPDVELPPVPAAAVKAGKPTPAAPAPADGIVVVRVVYSAVERDTFTPDDEIQRAGNGLLYVDRSGRAVVITARSLVDASYTESDGYGAPEIADEQIKVVLPGGAVLRAGRVWVDADDSDLAALVLDSAPPDLVGTAADRLAFAVDLVAPQAPGVVRLVGPDGAPLAPIPLGSTTAQPEALGGVFVGDGKARGVVVADDRTAVGDGAASLASVVWLHRVPAELRPQGL
ncbi:MAG: MCE family protein [Phycisphaerales bacterium]|nr:MCE family protein [Phycisphaerales bacterium]